MTPDAHCTLQHHVTTPAASMHKYLNAIFSRERYVSKRRFIFGVIEMIIFALVSCCLVTIKYAQNVDGNVNIYYSVRVQFVIGVRCFLSIRVPEQICNFPLCRIGGINLDKIKNTNWFIAGLVKRRSP